MDCAQFTLEVFKNFRDDSFEFKEKWGSYTIYDRIVKKTKYTHKATPNTYQKEKIKEQTENNLYLCLVNNYHHKIIQAILNPLNFKMVIRFYHKEVESNQFAVDMDVFIYKSNEVK